MSGNLPRLIATPRRAASLLALPLLLASVALAYLFLIGNAGAANTTLFPERDRANLGSWSNNIAQTCGTGSVGGMCATKIDEDIDTPDDTDFIISTLDPVNKTAEFELNAAAGDTSNVTQLVVRYRAFATGTKSATLRLEVIDGGDLVIDSPPNQALTAVPTTYSYTLSALNLTQAQVNAMYVRVVANTSGVGTPTTVTVTDINLDATYNQVTPNPVLPTTCGLDLVLVMDTSGSIDSTELSQMKTAYNQFVDALVPGTPTQIAIVDFDTQAFVAQNFTNNPALLHTAVNNAVSDGLTNWDDAIFDARNLFPNRAMNPDLMIVASDGNPNTIGHGPTSFVGEAPAVQAAITQANAAKSAGIRMMALGIGSEPLVGNLNSISSPDAVTTTNFSALATDLENIAKALCGGTISVHKLIDADGDPNTTGDQTSTSGWTFSANVTSGPGDFSTPPFGPTDISGYVLFDITLGGDQTATVNVVETVQSGYAIIASECHIYNNGPIGTVSGNAVNGIVLGPLDIVLCTFVNSLQKDFVVSKDFVPNFGAPVNVTLACANGIIAPGSASVTETMPQTFTVTGYNGDPSCTATESPIPQGYESTGTCTANLNAGGCTITNTLRTANFNVTKDFSDNSAGMVVISLTCTSGTVTTSDSSASEADDANFLVTGFDVGATCTATEAVPAGYSANQSACQNVPIVHTGVATCQIVNTLRSGTLTVQKDFVPDNGASVPISVTCSSGTLSSPTGSASESTPAVFTLTGFNAGATCTATETVPPGYNANQASCANVTIVDGGNATCTIVNAAVTANFTVNKDFSDNNAASVTVSLSCASGSVSPASASASESTPATFTVFAFTGDPMCTATESPVPTNYTSTATCSAPLVSVGQCTITNVYTPVFGVAQFFVYKDFTDNNPQNVTVVLSCSPGTVQSVDDPTASESDPADFTVEAQPGTTCSATELPVAGYVANTTGCQNVPLTTGSCTIVNTPGTPPVGGIVDVVVAGPNGSSSLPLMQLAGAIIAAVAFAGAGRLAWARRRIL